MATVVMIPSAWFLIEGLVRNAVDTTKKAMTIKLDAQDQALRQQIITQETLLKNELLFITLSNTLSQLSQKPIIPDTQIHNLMNSLTKVSKVKEIDKKPIFSDILSRIITIFAHYNKEQYLQKTAILFPTLIAHSQEIHTQLLFYYGTQLLADTDIKHLQTSHNFKTLKTYINYAERSKNEQNSLAVKALVYFHLANNKRNPTTLSLLKSASHLKIRKRAEFLRNILRNTKPHFWQNNPSPLDYRIAKTASQFVTAYQSELETLASSNGVKETLLKMYAHAITPENIKISKYMVYFFYKLSPH